MNSEVLTLGSLCEAIIDCEHKTAPVEDEGVPSIRTTDIRGGVIDFKGANKISEETYNEWTKRREPKEGDLIFCREAPVGEVGRLRGGERAALGQRTVLLCPDQQKVDPRYLHYLLMGHELQYLMDGWSTGSTVAHLNVADIRKLPIPHIHNLKHQKFIGELLDRIDVLRQNLNEISSINGKLIGTLLRSWFIDFNPVKAKAEGKTPYGMDEETAALFPDTFEDSELGAIPTGWKVKSLLEVSNLYDNLRVPLSSMEREERKGDYPYHGATSVMDYVDDFIYDGVHLLIAEDGSVVNEDGYPVLQYVWGKFWVNNHAHVLQGKDDVTTEHLHQYLKHFYIQPFVTGAVQLKINQKALNNVKLVIAPEKINKAFNKIIQSFYRSIRVNEMKNENLTLTRDALLPRLMSGELEI